MQTYLEGKSLDEDILLRTLKAEKLNIFLRMIIWIRSNLTNEVLTKVDSDKLEKIKWRLEAGSTSVRTKIEDALIKDYKCKEEQEIFGVEDIRETKKVRPEDYHISKFKKWHVIGFEILRLITKIIASNTDNFCYIFMIIAHIENGTFLSLVYPMSIFAYALFEEARPKSTYWMFIIIYT